MRKVNEKNIFKIYILLVLFVIAFVGCDKTDNKTKEASEGNANMKLTIEYVCEVCNVDKSEFDGVDFDAFVDYYDLTEESISKVKHIDILIANYKELAYKIKMPDYKKYFKYNTNELNVEERDNIEAIYTRRMSDMQVYTTIYDFRNEIVMAEDWDLLDMPLEDYIKKKTDDSLMETIKEYLDQADVYNWVLTENDEKYPDIKDACDYFVRDCYIVIVFKDGSKFGVHTDRFDFDTKEHEEMCIELVKKLEELAEK